MRKIIAITHVTLDGIMQSPGDPEEDPTGGFTKGAGACPSGRKIAARLCSRLCPVSSTRRWGAAPTKSSRRGIMFIGF
jgi:hypothetical protein